MQADGDADEPGTMPGQDPSSPPVRSSFPDSKQWVLPSPVGHQYRRSGVLPEMRKPTAR